MATAIEEGGSAAAAHLAHERHLDLLRNEWEDGYLIVQLVVEGMDPAEVATTPGVFEQIFPHLPRTCPRLLPVVTIARQGQNTVKVGAGSS
jgi:hypothetical protein